MLLETMMKKAAATGAAVEKTTTAGGVYYDGAEHGYIKDAFFASSDEHSILSAVYAAAARAGFIVEYRGHYTALYITTKKTAAESAADAAAAAFNNAFWLAIHNGMPQHAAVESGRAAVAAAAV